MELYAGLADCNTLLLKQAKGLGLFVFRPGSGDLVQHIHEPLPFAGQFLLARLQFCDRLHTNSNRAAALGHWGQGAGGGSGPRAASEP
jgi:hypothetical protein